MKPLLSLILATITAVGTSVAAMRWYERAQVRWKEEAAEERRIRETPRLEAEGPWEAEELAGGGTGHCDRQVRIRTCGYPGRGSDIGQRSDEMML